MPETYARVIVIGTGIGGLSAAKTFLELEPNVDILLLEKRETLGGVWAKGLCYEGLKTNNLHGTYEWADFPMTPEKFDVKEGCHIPGLSMHKYMNAFADHWDISRRIRYRTAVVEVEKLDDKSWRLTAQSTSSDGTIGDVTYSCEKLIVPSGLASLPNPVTLPGVEIFGKPAMSHAKLRTDGQKLAEDPNVQSVAIIGASKSGYDSVHLMASHGKKVEWIIRKTASGGAVHMSPPWVPMFGKPVMLEHVATMRFFTWFSPCIWGAYDGFGWIRGFLHRTRIGRWLTHNLWERIHWDGVAGNGYRSHESRKHLEPDQGLFWTARVGIHNYGPNDTPGDIHRFIESGQVTITKQDISNLSEGGTINFKNAASVQVDGLIQTTGWHLVPTIKYSPPGIESKLGIPHIPKDDTETKLWNQLNDNAEKQILSSAPYLLRPPKKLIPYKQEVTPWRLYRGIAPPGLTVENDHSLVFMKFVHSTSNFIIAESQALWAYAYLNDKLPIDNDDVYYNTALTSRYSKVRYPCGFSQWFPEFIWDVVPYADMLLWDLGIKRHRKKTWRDEIFAGYVVQDYKGINQEWKERLRLHV